MIDTRNIENIFDAKAIDSNGDKVGTVKQVYTDEVGQPIFATISTGLFGTSESFVPLQGANFENNELHIGYSKAKVKDAPRVEAEGEVSVEEQNRVFDYYYETDAANPDSAQAVGNDSTAGQGAAGAAGAGAAGHTAAGHGRADQTTADHEAGAPGSGDSMTRSEEHLNVGTESVPAGRARLRKHVVTEQQTVTVPVQREELRVEHEPITDATTDEATAGPALTEDEHDITLNEERIVVEKETVPVERVRATKETVTDQKQVSEEVAHEEIELDEDGPASR